MRRPTPLSSAVALALGASLPGHAVQLNTDGHGQALIYPYYTVRAAPDGNAFNTYLSVVNTTTQAKAVRVRLREGRIGRAVLDKELQEVIDQRTEPWGVSVQSVELREIKIPGALQDTMSRQAQAERERQAKAGIETLDFGPAASQEFLKKANDAAWQGVIAKSPDTGKKLRELAGN